MIRKTLGGLSQLAKVLKKTMNEKGTKNGKVKVEGWRTPCWPDNRGNPFWRLVHSGL